MIPLQDEDDLSVALRELDKARALVHKRRSELNSAIPAPSPDCLTQDESIDFRERSRLMNEAIQPYRLAVGVFNAACHKERSIKIRPAVPRFLSATQHTRRNYFFCIVTRQFLQIPFPVGDSSQTHCKTAAAVTGFLNVA
jgi:hypothetical protein